VEAFKAAPHSSKAESAPCLAGWRAGRTSSGRDGDRGTDPATSFSIHFRPSQPPGSPCHPVAQAPRRIARQRPVKRTGAASPSSRTSASRHSGQVDWAAAGAGPAPRSSSHAHAPRKYLASPCAARTAPRIVRPATRCCNWPGSRWCRQSPRLEHSATRALPPVRPLWATRIRAGGAPRGVLKGGTPTPAPSGKPASACRRKVHQSSPTSHRGKRADARCFPNAAKKAST